MSITEVFGDFFKGLRTKKEQHERAPRDRYRELVHESVKAFKAGTAPDSDAAFKILVDADVSYETYSADVAAFLKLDELRDKRDKLQAEYEELGPLEAQTKAANEEFGKLIEEHDRKGLELNARKNRCVSAFSELQFVLTDIRNLEDRIAAV